MDNTYYPQMPYTPISEDDYRDYVGTIQKIDWSAIYDGVDNLDGVSERYCTSDKCLI
jgi:hypothetical protein